MSSIVEQSKGLLDSIQSKDSDKIQEESRHSEEIVALDNNYEQKSHKFAKDFLKSYQEKTKTKEASRQTSLLEGVLDQSRSLFENLKSKNDLEEMSIEQMKSKLEAYNS